MSTYRSRIVGTGLGIPSKVITNADLEKIVDTSDEWIRTRTGICERRAVDQSKGEGLSSLGAVAARMALSRAGLDPKDMDLIICCTATPDTFLPMSSSRIGDMLGISPATFDLNSACSGFVTGLQTADAFIRSGIYKNVLLVGGDIFTTGVVDFTDRNTCVLFGDGVGAAVLARSQQNDESKDPMVIKTILHTLFDREESLGVLGGGSRSPEGHPNFKTVDKPHITMSGQDVFKAASRSMANVAMELLEATGIRPEQVKWLVPHQANLRIIEMVAKLLEFPMEKVFVNLDRWGNTSAGTVIICLAEMEQQGLLKAGDLVMLDVFGGGYTYGASLIRWG